MTDWKSAVLALFFFSPLLITKGQCPSTVSLQGESPRCLGTTLMVAATVGINYSKIDWFADATLVHTTYATTVSGNGITVAGGNGQGAAANQITPWGVYVDNQGNVYAVDILGDRVEKWAPGASSGIVVAGGNGAGSAANQLANPLGLAVDAAGNLFVVDNYNHRVQRWAPGATMGVTVAGGNGKGSASNQLNYPANIVLDAAGNMYIGDTGNGRVQKWARGATSGITVATFDGYGLAIDGAGNIYCSDETAQSVVKWVPGATSGITVAGGNGYGAADNQFSDPLSIVVDTEGNLFVGDFGNHRVMEWTPGATTGILVAGGNGAGSAANQIMAPDGLYIDAGGNFYVADGSNSRVQKWPVPTIVRSYQPATAGIYTAIITTDKGCTITSNSVTVNPMVTPDVQIAATTASIPVCGTAVIDAHPVNGGAAPSFQWLINGQNAGTNSVELIDAHVSDGDQITCKMVSDVACPTISPVLSNSITLHLDPSSAPALNIDGSSPEICAGKPVTFSAMSSPAVSTGQFTWEVNGLTNGVTGSSFETAQLKDGDKVSCVLTTSDGCQLAISNNITMKVDPAPSIPAGQIFVVTSGSGVMLTPAINGDGATFSWSPAAGLSNSTIREPIANPVQTTTYTLQVTTSDGCLAAGDITVAVSSDVRIPNAFTPNGDGKNDRFYVLGGPYGSEVANMSIYNRWGQKIFQVQHAAPNDPAGGWDGSINGQPAAPGVYAYFVQIRLKDGAYKKWQGTFVLVR